MRSWMKHSMYIISLILVALILLPSLAVGKPPEDKDKDKDNGKPPKTEDEDKGNGKPPKTEDEDKDNGKPPKTEDEDKGNGKPPKTEDEDKGNGKPPKTEDEDKGNGKPPKTEDEDKDNGKPPKTEDEDNGKPPKTKDEVKFVTITSSSGPNGNVSPSGSVKVKIGDNQRFRVRANGGYRIDTVAVDDGSPSGFEESKEGNKHIREWEHLFENVQEAHRISATFARDVFTLKALARGPGRIIPPGAVKVSYGGNQEFEIRATQGFCIDDVQISPSIDSNTLDISEAKGASTYKFSIEGVTSDCTIIVTFARLKEPETLTIKASAGDGGSIKPSGKVEVEYGSDQTFTIKPDDSCHRIAVVEVDGEEVGVDIDAGTGEVTYTFSNVTSDHTIHAKFEEITYTITATAEGGGSIEPSGDVEVVCDSEQVFTMTPDDLCHRIAMVEVDGVPVDVGIDEVTGEVTYTFSNVTSGHAIHATFEEITEPYIITASAGDFGSIFPSDDVEVACGSEQVFTIKPGDPCHRIAMVEVDGVSVDAGIDELTGEVTYTFSNVTSNHTINATFAEITCTITATAGGGGSIFPSDDVEVACGSEQVSFTIKPDDSCHRIAVVEVDGEKVDVGIDEVTGEVTYTFSNVTSNHTINATFEEITCTITATAESGGSIEPSGDVEVACGSEQVFTIKPSEPCYGIAVVEVDGEEVGVDIDAGTGEVTYTFSDVTLGHTIHATFEEITESYIITASAGDFGSIEPSGNLEVACGSEQVSFTIKPDDPCHRIAMVEVDGEEVGVDIAEGAGEVTYTFSNVTSNHTINATFEEVTEPYIITASAGDFGSIFPSDDVEVACGSEQVFTITPGEPCYGIAVVEVDGVPVDAGIDEATGEVKYTFTSVASDHTINATFEKITYAITATAEGGGGSIEPSGEVQVECGGSQLFKIRPDDGYTRGIVLVDENPVKTKGNKYEFTDVRETHTIKVTFVEDLDEDDLKGDVNNDGKVGSDDAILILLIVTGQIDPTEEQKLAADVNGDGVIDVNDALLILKIVAGLSAPDANVDSALLQNFPNPFNPETWIPFTLSEGSEVTIEIYDVTGHLLRRLPLGHKPAGFYTSQERAAYWDGCNEDGERVASGVYFYAIRAADFTDMRKMIIAQ